MTQADIWEYLKDRRPSDILVDLRDPALYKLGSIPDAINIPMDDIGALYRLPKDKDIYVFCQTGEYSGEIAILLSDAGYTVCNLTGGYREYMRRKLTL